ncbi:PP2C family serine/threonine-protein phosphatase [Brevibacterium samyangense]|uniref:PPM-type phosphatase domain-containing protein n=1 Tax=Brevibacterium samyangense TaxID=366888 RepID=A0ABN2T3G2_9MICO
MSETHPVLRYAARSHTGLTRKNNQDSGFAGPNFLLIADGMGGHAGGDVASAITVARLQGLGDTGDNPDALDLLRSSILDANERIARTVVDNRELAGMGTTVTALLRDGNRFALAHIGDSRAYLLRDGVLTQVTHDHTFVQLLVDEGRITPEEAETHPQRSVVMRVLGDVGASPELDMSYREARIGDRWMLCSDGLTGFASMDDIKAALEGIEDPGACADRLVDYALQGGGADNVTVVIGDVVAAPDDTPSATAEALPGTVDGSPSDTSGSADADTVEFQSPAGSAVGSVAINPQYAQLGTAAVASELVQTGPHSIVEENLTDTTEMPAIGYGYPGDAVDGAPTQPMTQVEDGTDPRTLEIAPGTHSATGASGAPGTAGDTPGTPADASAGHDSEDDLASWGEEDLTRTRKRPIVGIVVTLAVVAAVVLAIGLGWAFVRSQYYVAAHEGNVAVYRGIPQEIGPLEFSEIAETTEIEVDRLGTFSQSRLEETIPADSREAADDIVDTLGAEAARNAEAATIQGGAAEVDPTPAPTQGATGVPADPGATRAPTDSGPSAPNPTSSATARMGA